MKNFFLKRGRAKVVSVFCALVLFVSLLFTMPVAIEAAETDGGTAVISTETVTSETAQVTVNITFSSTDGNNIKALGGLLTYDDTLLAYVSETNNNTDVYPRADGIYLQLINGDTTEVCTASITFNCNFPLDGSVTTIPLQFEFSDASSPWDPSGTVLIEWATSDYNCAKPDNMVITNGAVNLQKSTYKVDPVSTYKVDYAFVSGTSGETLPASVTALLPASVTGLADGAVQASPTITPTTINVTGGTWTFEGWDKSSVTINSADDIVTGEWTYEANPISTYSVYYNFTSGTSGETLPTEVTSLLPTAVTGLADGAVQASPTVTPATVSVTGGTWTFGGWNKTSATINGADEIVSGSWTYEADPVSTYCIYYSFNCGTSGETLPSEVTSLLPAALTGLANGATQSCPSIASTVSVAGGTWTFGGWDKANVTINGADENVTGTWTYEADPVSTYSVEYVFVSGTSGKTLPSEVTGLCPAAVTGLASGTVHGCQQVTSTTVSVADGTWTFSGWDKESVTLNGANETVTGTWIYTANGNGGSNDPGTNTNTNSGGTSGRPSNTKVYLPKTGDSMILGLSILLIAVPAVVVGKTLVGSKTKKEN